MKNEKIREALKKNDLYLWELAKLLGISESTMTRMMRDELPSDRQDELISLIRRERETA